jgi:hypothetical protein
VKHEPIKDLDQNIRYSSNTELQAKPTIPSRKKIRFGTGKMSEANRSAQKVDGISSERAIKEKALEHNPKSRADQVNASRRSLAKKHNQDQKKTQDIESLDDVEIRSTKSQQNFFNRRSQLT